MRLYSAGIGIGCLSGVDRHERSWNETSKIVVPNDGGAAIL